MPKTLLTALLALILLAACVAPSVAPTPAPVAPTEPLPAPTVMPSATSAPSATPAPTATSVPTETPAPTPTPEPLAVALDPALPDELRAAFTQAIEASAGGALPLAVAADEEPGAAAVRLTADQPEGKTLAERFYAAVVPFATVRDDITLDELKARWAGTGSASSARHVIYIARSSAFRYGGPGERTPHYACVPLADETQGD
jgi:poly-gamma-glutamate synthesis protein (capsule biosynthesis protein)